MVEEWRTIEGFPEYMVSNTGKILGAKGKVLKPLERHDDEFGSVMLYNDGVIKRVGVHIIVANAFLDKPKQSNGNYWVISPKNGNYRDYSADNLVYNSRGATHGGAVYVDREIVEQKLKEGKSKVKIAREIGTNTTRLRRVLYTEAKS